MSEDWPVRKRLRLPGYNYSHRGTYFLTICVKGRHEILGTIYRDSTAIEGSDVGDAVLCVPPLSQATARIRLSDVGISVKEYLEQMDMQYRTVSLDNSVIMPNHVHLLISIKDTVCDNGRTASPAKVSPMSAIIPKIVRGMKSYTTKKLGQSIWQRSYYDHIVRNDSEYLRIWEYINTNAQIWENDIFYKDKNTNFKL